MLNDSDCRYPENQPRTAYGKGCRCERCVTEKRAYYERNKERHHQAVLKWRAKNSELHSDATQRWRDANAEHLRKLAREWAQDNVGRHRAKGARYRARVKAAMVGADESAILELIYRCRPDGYAVDHIVPLSKGGEHSPHNLQYLIASENSRKGDRMNYEPPPEAILDWHDVIAEWFGIHRPAS